MSSLESKIFLGTIFVHLLFQDMLVMYFLHFYLTFKVQVAKLQRQIYCNIKNVAAILKVFCFKNETFMYLTCFRCN